MQFLPYRARGVTEWFDDYDNDVNYMLYLLQSQDLYSFEHLCEILDRHIQKHQLTEDLLEEWCLFLR